MNASTRKYLYDLSDALRQSGQFFESGNFWVHGKNNSHKIEDPQGWKVHFGDKDIEGYINILENCLIDLLDQNIAFKLIDPAKVENSKINPESGSLQAGKFITIYLCENDKLRITDNIARCLIGEIKEGMTKEALFEKWDNNRHGQVISGEYSPVNNLSMRYGAFTKEKGTAKSVVFNKDDGKYYLDQRGEIMPWFMDKLPDIQEKFTFECNPLYREYIKRCDERKRAQYYDYHGWPDDEKTVDLNFYRSF